MSNRLNADLKDEAIYVRLWRCPACDSAWLKASPHSVVDTKVYHAWCSCGAQEPAPVLLGEFSLGDVFDRLFIDA